MSLISLNEVKLSFGGPLIFDDLNLQIEQGERVALIGRNGVGKTSLMKVIARELYVDDGKIAYQKGLTVTHLPQEIPKDMGGKTFDIVLSGLGKRAKLISDYYYLSKRLAHESSPEPLKRLDAMQAELERTEGWKIESEVESAISHLGLDPESEFTKLSGGQKRRVLLARALVINPDLLMLDEPTNHLDIDSIQWLEEFLKACKSTLFFVTHDRAFMKNLATRTIELDRGRIFNWQCDYETFLQRKQHELDAEQKQSALFDKKLATEEAWLRKGVRARRTRNEGRVRALMKMREEKRARRAEIGNAKMLAQNSELSGRQVIKASDISFGYEENPIALNFSTLIMRGDKVGIIGPNGCGKTTLINLLLGNIVPQNGEVVIGTNLEVAYFDQLREQLDETKNVMDNVGGGKDTITINGKERHIIGYLQDFLFSSDRCKEKIYRLSGGERNRLTLAKLFTKPSNLLVMDEPTNDLDIETLELLEDLLVEYPGTIILVSHDREFLDSVVTSTIVFEGDGKINEYPGGYYDWLSQTDEQVKESQKAKDGNKEIEPEAKPAKKPTTKPKKLSFKKNKELEDLPQLIEKLEQEQKEIFNILSDADYYKKDPKEIESTQAKSQELEENISSAYERWNYLEQLREEIQNQTD
ncbi:MAG: ATP-binding cassette domain-containing protein [Candidatus Dadabacteria bacterium]|nr:ATP-binding cassette domain-containing protein [Candidatus Dadabacteria bacterium]NIS08732.1 ATP-binding cassette domain-containing protein [Candidatus Dadabacteria bacterium]NIV42616.1 ATP-binding cassette domain-containing protein [Candidatus Dadabacteria bacterium]NIX15418.1 ATP-binding cassette domain-containing protein [Candidatus Dadabacteria bacterium]NIY22081.1 ATP-binding cassette domain-containing protein [Candidatus Dadabacteria bacterium]